MQCDHGEIEVFLCPEDESAFSPAKSAGAVGGASSDEATETDTESEASPLKTAGAGPSSAACRRQRLPSPPPRLELSEEESRTSSSELGQIRNVLISASEDFGPMGNRLQLQTLDQDQSKCQTLAARRQVEGVLRTVQRRNKRRYLLVPWGHGTVAVLHPPWKGCASESVSQ